MTSFSQESRDLSGLLDCIHQPLTVDDIYKGYKLLLTETLIVTGQNQQTEGEDVKIKAT
jgi:hypothetical protein